MKEYRKDVSIVKDIAYMMDPSVLKPGTSIKGVEAMVEACKEYNFGSCLCWPCYYPQLVKMLKGTNTAFGTLFAFPSGQETMRIKVHLAHELMKLNPAENDMVMNVDYLKTGQYDLVPEDIKAVREVTEGTSPKVIIGAIVLTNDEIRKACELVIEGGVDYVESGTGFPKGLTTLHHMEVMKEVVRDRAKIKAAGGVRDPDTMLKMYRRGACRFGIGFTSALKIIEEVTAVGHDIDMSIID